MKLVAIILNYQTPSMTLQAADAALKELDRIEGEWRLVIIDNDSQDGSFDKITREVNNHLESEEYLWKRVVLMRSRCNGGFGAGNNIGIRRFLGGDNPPKYFYVLNSDAFPERDSVKCLLDYLENHPDAGIVGSYLRSPDGEPLISAFRFPSIIGELEGSVRLGLLTKLLRKYVVPIGIPDQSAPVDWLAGASMMIRREVLNEIGLFDENYFLYFEETDLCYRAKKAGWLTVYIRRSSVVHIGGASTGMETWSRVPRYWMDSRRLYFSKNYGVLNYYIATFVRIAGELIWKLRVRIERKEDDNPGNFVGDMTKHLFNPNLER
jgi:GT2 family glycosyltransferase